MFCWNIENKCNNVASPPANQAGLTGDVQVDIAVAQGTNRETTGKLEATLYCVENNLRIYRPRP